MESIQPQGRAIQSISHKKGMWCVCVCEINSLTQDNVEKKLGLVKFLKFSSANDAAKPPLRVVGSDLNFPPIFHIVGKGSHGDWCWKESVGIRNQFKLFLQPCEIRTNSSPFAFPLDRDCSYKLKPNLKLLKEEQNFTKNIKFKADSWRNRLFLQYTTIWKSPGFLVWTQKMI